MEPKRKKDTKISSDPQNRISLPKSIQCFQIVPSFFLLT